MQEEVFISASVDQMIYLNTFPFLEHSCHLQMCPCVPSDSCGSLLYWAINDPNEETGWACGRAGATGRAGILRHLLLFSGFAGGGWNRPLCYSTSKYFQDIRHGYSHFPLWLTAGGLVAYWVLGFIPIMKFCIFAFMTAISFCFPHRPPIQHGFIQQVSWNHCECSAKIIFRGFYLRFIWGFEDLIRYPVISPLQYFQILIKVELGLFF